MSDDYLWDKSGEPDPDVRHLEEILGRFRHPDAAQPDGAPGPAALAPLPTDAPVVRKSRGRWLVLAPLAAAAVIAIVLRFHQEPPVTPPPGPSAAQSSWSLNVLAGRPSIEGIPLEGHGGSLAPGQWLETDDASRAQISISGVGYVEIGTATRMRLLVARPGEHGVEIARGSISTMIFAPPRVFFVQTPSARAVDLGCSYTLSVDPFGATQLRVRTGWVAFEFQGVETKVPAGAECTTRRETGPGLPVFEDAPRAFRAAASRFEAGEGDTKDLESLLDSARVRDGLTLWYLMPRVAASERARIHERLAKLVPPPQGVTGEAVVAREPAALARWQSVLEATWSPFSTGWKDPDDGRK